jgi:hypothetical protein
MCWTFNVRIWLRFSFFLRQVTFKQLSMYTLRFVRDSTKITIINVCVSSPNKYIRNVCRLRRQQEGGLRSDLERKVNNILSWDSRMSRTLIIITIGIQAYQAHTQACLRLRPLCMCRYCSLSSVDILLGITEHGRWPMLLYVLKRVAFSTINFSTVFSQIFLSL